jgi:hypothetical protein
MEAIRSSETSVLLRATRCHLPEDYNHHGHRRGNLKSNLLHLIISYRDIISTSPILYYLFNILSVVRLSPLGTAATTGLLCKPQMIDDGDCAEICGMKFGMENRGTRRKPAPVPLCPPQIPHDLAWVRTRSAAVGSQRLTA